MFIPFILGESNHLLSKETFDCAVNHLTDKNLLDKDFNYVSEKNVADCSSLKAFVTENIETPLMTLFNEDKDFAPYSKCIMKILKDFNVSDTYIAKFVYEQDKTMSKLRRQRLVSDTLSIIEYKLELAEEICAPEKMFGDWFESSYENYAEALNSTEDDDDLGDLQEDYCQRKYLVEKNFIDLSVYNVTVNPKNINTSDVNCKKLWFEAAEDYIHELKSWIVTAFDEMSNKEIRCIADTIRNGKYAQYELKIWLFSHLNLTESQKTDEKEKFINYMKKLFENILECRDDEDSST